MNKLTEEAVVEVTATDVSEDVKAEEKKEEMEGETPEHQSSYSKNTEVGERKLPKSEEDKEILRFTMLFNKFSSELVSKKGSRSGEEVKKMFFNKEATIRPNVEPPFSETSPPARTSQHKTFKPFQSADIGKPQISEPPMMLASSLNPAEAFDKMLQSKVTPGKNEAETSKKLNKRNSKPERDCLVQSNIHSQTDLRVFNSLTSLSCKPVLRGVLLSKIPSLTSIDVNTIDQETDLTRIGYWDHWDDLTLIQSDADKPLSLQVSKSNNDNRRPSKCKKEDPASASDSRLLSTDCEIKKSIKKCDKKSRGDSPKKERESGRKQVQWKTEVDVIYFSTHLSANGDQSGEVLGRMIEPLREEWEQQRKGFYAKLIPFQKDGHLKDRFISLLKI